MWYDKIDDLNESNTQQTQIMWYEMNDQHQHQVQNKMKLNNQHQAISLDKMQHLLNKMQHH